MICWVRENALLERIRSQETVFWTAQKRKRSLQIAEQNGKFWCSFRMVWVWHRGTPRIKLPWKSTKRTWFLINERYLEGNVSSRCIDVSPNVLRTRPFFVSCWTIRCPHTLPFLVIPSCLKRKTPWTWKIFLSFSKSWLVKKRCKCNWSYRFQVEVCLCELDSGSSCRRRSLERWRTQPVEEEIPRGNGPWSLSVSCQVSSCWRCWWLCEQSVGASPAALRAAPHLIPPRAAPSPPRHTSPTSHSLTTSRKGVMVPFKVFWAVHWRFTVWPSWGPCVEYSTLKFPPHKRNEPKLEKGWV